MSVETTREAMTGYLQALLDREDYGRYLSEDAVLTLVGDGRQAAGCEAVKEMMDHLYQQAFDATPELRNLVCEDGQAAVEAVLVGLHIGEFGGVPATGREICVPYTMMYDLEQGRIKALRVYLPMHLLLAQIDADAREIRSPHLSHAGSREESDRNRLGGSL